MHPMPYEYHELQLERFTAAFSTIAPERISIVPKLYIAAGEPIVSRYDLCNQAYLITSGEVIILRDGQPVDLLEEDELLDLAFLPETVAIAHRSCTLIPMATIRHPL